MRRVWRNLFLPSYDDFGVVSADKCLGSESNPKCDSYHYEEQELGQFINLFESTFGPILSLWTFFMKCTHHARFWLLCAGVPVSVKWLSPKKTKTVCISGKKTHRCAGLKSWKSTWSSCLASQDFEGAKIWWHVCIPTSACLFCLGDPAL